MPLSSQLAIGIQFLRSLRRSAHDRGAQLAPQHVCEDDIVG
mgnify:CR=1 FL=1